MTIQYPMRGGRLLACSALRRNKRCDSSTCPGHKQRDRPGCYFAQKRDLTASTMPHSIWKCSQNFCRRITVFTVTSLDDRCRRMRGINTYPTCSRNMVTECRWRLGTAQQAILNVDKLVIELTGVIGAWIQISWADLLSQCKAKISYRS